MLYSNGHTSSHLSDIITHLVAPTVSATLCQSSNNMTVHCHSRLSQPYYCTAGFIKSALSSLLFKIKQFKVEKTAKCLLRLCLAVTGTPVFRKMCFFIFLCTYAWTMNVCDYPAWCIYRFMTYLGRHNSNHNPSFTFIFQSSCHLLVVVMHKWHNAVLDQLKWWPARTKATRFMIIYHKQEVWWCCTLMGI